jgi:NAD-dependent deacetylase
MPGFENDVERLRSMIEESKRGVVFTGAGISTESGIPDFRSPGGIWTQYKPIDFRDFMASEEMRRESWRHKFASDAVIKKAQPNKGHLAVAKLVQKGTVSSVITQNIDGLHQLSGVPDDRVIELHGNTTYAACLNCGKRYELEDIRKVFDKDETLPVCDQCSGIIKTATISSSLVVYPAAGFPELARRNGARLVILNRDPTPLDGIADLALHSEIGPTLSAVVDFD